MIISQLTPYHYGNPWFSTKIEFLEKQITLSHNTYFFGSSLVYRQIDTQLFDSTFNSISNEKLSSFNLGAPALFNPESYYLFENFLKSPLSKNAKYCFIELTEVNLIKDSRMHLEQTSYWQNYSDLLFVGNSIFSNNQLNQKQKGKAYLNYSVSYLENLLHLGHFRAQILHSNYYNKKYLGINNDGYLPLDYEYETTENKIIKDDFHARNQRFLENPKSLNTIKLKILNSYNSISKKYDQINLNRILDLIQKTKQKGINLIFILSPRMGGQKLINLSKKIPEINIIDMCNPQNHDLFYYNENSFDQRHFNSKGAESYSKYLLQNSKKKYERTTMCIINSGFSGRSWFIIFNEILY